MMVTCRQQQLTGTLVSYTVCNWSKQFLTGVLEGLAGFNKGYMLQFPPYVIYLTCPFFGGN